MSKRDTTKAEARSRLRELEQVYRANASQLIADEQRLNAGYWLHRAAEYQEQAEILLSKAATCRAKHKELQETVDDNEREAKLYLYRAGVCKTILSLTGRASDICLTSNARNSVEIYIALAQGDNDRAERLLNTDTEGRVT